MILQVPDLFRTEAMENRQQYANYDYSTLEVANQSPSPLHEGQEKYLAQDQHGAPEVVNTSNLPEVALKHEYITNAAPYGDTNTHSTSHAYPQSQYPQFQGPHSLATYDPETPVEKRRIWGMKRRTFFILLGVLLVVIIGAVVGGAVGATAGNNKNGEVTPGPVPDPTPSGNGTVGGDVPGIQSAILQNSRISAVNWTDDNAVAYHGVFWQADDDSLMISVRDSKTNSWTITNITGTLDAQNQAVAKSGTPLAAAALGAPWTQAPWGKRNGLVLFFLSPRNVIQSLAADLPGKYWRLGNLSKSNKNLEAAPDSQLSIWWAQCSTNCTFDISLWYEDKQQTLRQGTGKNNWAETPVSILDNIVPGAAIGNCALSPNYGQNGSDSWSSRVYYDQSGAISELLHHEEAGVVEDWAYGTLFTHPLPSNHLNQSVPPRLTEVSRSNRRHACRRSLSQHSSTKLLPSRTTRGRQRRHFGGDEHGQRDGAGELLE